MKMRESDRLGLNIGVLTANRPIFEKISHIIYIYGDSTSLVVSSLLSGEQIWYDMWTGS